MPAHYTIVRLRHIASIRSRSNVPNQYRIIASSGRKACGIHFAERGRFHGTVVSEEAAYMLELRFPNLPQTGRVIACQTIFRLNVHGLKGF